jgi:hypothetical protein
MSAEWDLERMRRNLTHATPETRKLAEALLATTEATLAEQRAALVERTRGLEEARAVLAGMEESHAAFVAGVEKIERDRDGLERILRETAGSISA